MRYSEWVHGIFGVFGGYLEGIWGIWEKMPRNAHEGFVPGPTFIVLHLHRAACARFSRCRSDRFTQRTSASAPETYLLPSPLEVPSQRPQRPQRPRRPKIPQKSSQSAGRILRPSDWVTLKALLRFLLSNFLMLELVQSDNSS